MQQERELQRYSALEQRSALVIKQPNFLKQECKIMAGFHSWKRSNKSASLACFSPV